MFFVETKASFAPSMLTGFMNLNGQSVGVVANQSIDNERLTSCACEKAAKFIRFCDSFNMPVVSFTDVDGFNASVAEEKNRHV